MPIYSISKSLRWQGTITDKVAQVCRMFGLTADRLTERRVNHSCRLEINDGDIVYITGPSGAGKTILLKELEKSIPASERANLNQPQKLSEGQKYRFRLAMALAAEKKFIFADEFCSELDRISAVVISHNIHRFAKRTGTTFILAASHDDILLDLAPDVLVVKELSGPAQVIYKQAKR